MFSILLSALAATAGSEPILVDDRPTISIDLRRYDLSDAQDMRGVEARIHDAANRVCIREYGVAIYLERIACVKSAIADGNKQLSQVAKDPSAAAVTAAAISISTK